MTFQGRSGKITINKYVVVDTNYQSKITYFLM